MFLLYDFNKKHVNFSGGFHETLNELLDTAWESTFEGLRTVSLNYILILKSFTIFKMIYIYNLLTTWVISF